MNKRSNESIDQNNETATTIKDQIANASNRYASAFGILVTIVSAVIYLNVQFTGVTTQITALDKDLCNKLNNVEKDINNKFANVQSEIANIQKEMEIIRTVMVMKQIMPKELAHTTIPEKK